MKKLLGIVVLGLFCCSPGIAKIVNKTFQFSCNNVFDSETRAIVTKTNYFHLFQVDQNIFFLLYLIDHLYVEPMLYQGLVS